MSAASMALHESGEISDRRAYRDGYLQAAVLALSKYGLRPMETANIALLPNDRALDDKANWIEEETLLLYIAIQKTDVRDRVILIDQGAVDAVKAAIEFRNSKFNVPDELLPYLLLTIGARESPATMCSNPSKLITELAGMKATTKRKILTSEQSPPDVLDSVVEGARQRGHTVDTARMYYSKRRAVDDEP